MASAEYAYLMRWALGTKLLNPDPYERFLERVDKNGPTSKFNPRLGRCWLWKLGKSQDGEGYGKFRLKGKDHRAHRFSYESHKGQIPAGLVIDHLCRVTMCVNPAHLEAVTQRENNFRGIGITSENSRKTHCKKGHEFTNENTYFGKNPSGRSRICRECHRIEQIKYTKRKKSDH